MTNERFLELFDKRKSGLFSESESAEWNEWIGQSEHIREMIERLLDDESLNKTALQVAKARQEDWLDIIEKLPELRPERVVVKRINNGWLLRKWVTVAAAILLVTLTSYWLINIKVSRQKLVATYNKQLHDIKPPDTTKARITLADGHVVGIDTFTNGVLAMQGKVNVVKTNDGQISYKKVSGPGGSSEVAYNILTNPPGSKIVSISLSDGTKIWLNNESTLRYPVVFNGNERHVELTGEAYFEVAPSFIKSGKKRPFYVTANDVTVEVLGTHYNVNSYSNEDAIKVTLLEGSVKVRRGQSVIIKPGEQASVFRSSQVFQAIPVQTVDLEKVMAWKNGTFYFSGENLSTIMKQLARYYNIDVEYEGDLSDKKFGGIISRNKNLNEVLSVLELSGMHFRIEGKKIIVTKQ